MWRRAAISVVVTVRDLREATISWASMRRGSMVPARSPTRSWVSTSSRSPSAYDAGTSRGSKTRCLLGRRGTVALAHPPAVGAHEKASARPQASGNSVGMDGVHQLLAAPRGTRRVRFALMQQCLATTGCRRGLPPRHRSAGRTGLRSDRKALAHRVLVASTPICTARCTTPGRARPPSVGRTT